LMPGCRLWLTSRKDFYRENRLQRDGPRADQANREWLDSCYFSSSNKELDQRVQREQTSGFGAVEIVGVQKRSEIVARIFERYRGRDPQSYGWLDERAFLEFLEEEFDAETLRLSNNPLFLTAMCYMYINHGERSNDLGTREEGRTLTELIVNCTKLLLVEVDKQKLHGVATDISVNRRLRYPDEKLAFLQFFAAKSFSDEALFRRNVFRLEDLYKAAEEFFQNASWPREILVGIRRRTRDNVVKVLIAQGVFVIVDEFPGEVLYDFPHRRFREVLAVQYLDTDPRHVDECIAVAGEVRYREFLISFFASSQRYQDRLLSALLERCDRSIRGEYYTNLVGDCLASKPGSYSATTLIDQWLRKILPTGEYERIPSPIVKHVEAMPEFLAWLNYQLSAAVKAGSPDEVRRYTAVLGQVAPSSLIAWAKAFFADPGLDETLVDDLFRVLRSDHLEGLRHVLVAANTAGFPHLAALTVTRKAAPRDAVWWRRLMMDLTVDARQVLVRSASRSYPRLGAAMKKWLAGYRRYQRQQQNPPGPPQKNASTGAPGSRTRIPVLPKFEEFWTVVRRRAKRLGRRLGVLRRIQQSRRDHRSRYWPLRDAESE
jgi:hypothetical protein